MAKDILSDSKFLFGQLNPVEPTKNQPTYTPLVDPLNALKDSLRTKYSPETTIGLTRFKAIVLRVEQRGAESSWWDNILPMTQNTDNADEKLLKIKAMIPEIHGSILPAPSTLGDENSQGADHGTIELYPTFATEFLNVPWAEDIKPGSIVWVTFENVENLEGGVLLGPIENRATGLEGAKAAMSAFERRFKMRMRSGGMALAADAVQIVQNFPDIKRTQKINPGLNRGQFPKGKGLFTNMYADLKEYPVSKAVSVGLDWIAVNALWQVEDGTPKKVIDPQRVIDMTKAYHDAGIQMYLWGYPQLAHWRFWVDYMFDIATQAEVCGVISDPEAGFKPPDGRNLSGEDRQEVVEFTNACVQNARDAGLVYGVTSYGYMQSQQVDVRFPLRELCPAYPEESFAIVQTYFSKPSYNLKLALKSYDIWRSVGFKNIIACGGLGGSGEGYRVSYPQYNSPLKPPEEILKRTAWVLGSQAQEYIDYKDAFIFWKWKQANQHVTSWPTTRWNLLADITNKVKEYSTSLDKTAVDQWAEVSKKQKSTQEEIISGCSACTHSGITVEQAALPPPPTSPEIKALQAEADAIALSIAPTPGESQQSQKKVDELRQQRWALMAKIALKQKELGDAQSALS